MFDDSIINVYLNKKIIKNYSYGTGHDGNCQRPVFSLA